MSEIEESIIVFGLSGGLALGILGTAIMLFAAYQVFQRYIERKKLR
ncbi:MAG: hypothetical protein H6Q67_782 [Firmicutes bacterium]|nr:hypothetical protein [Bacillota bacterium]